MSHECPIKKKRDDLQRKVQLSGPSQEWEERWSELLREVHLNISLKRDHLDGIPRSRREGTHSTSAGLIIYDAAPFARTLAVDPDGDSDLQNSVFGLFSGGAGVLRVVLEGSVEQPLKGEGRVLHQLEPK